MALKGRYIIELCEKTPTEEAIRAAKARLDGDAELTEISKKRARYSKDDRWWSVLAGVFIVILFILYTANLYTAANIMAALLCLYLAGVFAWIMAKRALLRRTPAEISPARSADAMFRSALGMPQKGRDITRLLDKAAVSALSKMLAEKTIPLMRNLGVEDVSWTLTTDMNPRFMDNASKDAPALPIIADAVATDAKGNSVEFIIEYCAAFAGGSTGDFTPVTCNPEIAGCIEREPRLMEEGVNTVTFKKCSACGARVSDRFLKAADGICPMCGGAKFDE